MSKVITYFQNKFQKNPELRTGVLGNQATQSASNLTKEEIADYRQWRNSPHCYRTGAWLRDQYDVHQRQPFCTDEGIDFISTSTSKSFRIHPALTKFSDKNMMHFYHMIAEKMEQLGYVRGINEKRKFNSPYWVETLQRQHFHSVYESDNAILRGFSEVQVRVMFKNKGFCYLELEAIASEFPHAATDFSTLLDALVE